MPAEKKLTLASVAQLLKRRKLLSDEQLEMVLEQGQNQLERLHKQLSSGRGSRYSQHNESVSPAEVISSFNLEIPGGKKLLSEDLITETLARAAGLTYLKIDPLKLDLDIVTSHISRAFALKNMMVPVDMVLTARWLSLFSTRAIIMASKNCSAPAGSVLSGCLPRGPTS